MSTSPNGRARALADVNRGTILAVVEIAAPVQKIFDALTSSDVTRWWGSPDTYQVTEWEADVRPGGKWRADGVGAADGHRFSVGGEYLEVSSPTRIAQIHRYQHGPSQMHRGKAVPGVHPRRLHRSGIGYRKMRKDVFGARRGEQ